MRRRPAQLSKQLYFALLGVICVQSAVVQTTAACAEAGGSTTSMAAPERLTVHHAAANAGGSAGAQQSCHMMLETVADSHGAANRAPGAAPACFPAAPSKTRWPAARGGPPRSWSPGRQPAPRLTPVCFRLAAQQMHDCLRHAVPRHEPASPFVHSIVHLKVSVCVPPPQR